MQFLFTYFVFLPALVVTPSDYIPPIDDVNVYCIDGICYDQDGVVVGCLLDDDICDDISGE